MGRLYVCVTTFTEDGHKIKEEFANGLTINYAYDGNGNCTKEWDNAGGCKRYRYDYLDRLIWVRENVALEKMTIVGQDIVGGLFAINIGKYQEGIKKVWYFAPDTLQWECMDMNYAEFIAWAIQGNTDEFYSSMRWKCWKEDCSKAEFDEMILIYPSLWSKECNLETAAKKVVSSDELIRMNSEFAQKFGYC